MAEQPIKGTSTRSLDEAIRKAAEDAEGKLPPGRHGKRLRIELEIEVGSPGRVTEYRAFLD